jgi:two-component system response regulator FixJ
MLAKKKQVYIVDDDLSVCRALDVLLGTYGFTVDTFTSAEEFFLTVPDNAAGCLLLDIHMPGRDGWEALQHLVTSGSSRPVIIISADKQEGLNEKALHAGAAGYLQKPFNDQDLVELINSAVEKKGKTDKTRK